jgi:tRNA nucleotidyltransferase (CCA-adding enzyme)
MNFDEDRHPRAHTGRFTIANQTKPEITIMANQVACTECGAQRARGVAHRCPAPGLMVLTDATKKVLEACRAAGGKPIIVGGSVRDALISRETATVPKDIDIEVYGVAEYSTLQKQLEKIGRVDLAGASFGVLIALVDGEDFDIALPRTDSKTGEGHRGFTTTANAALDEVSASGRRDYTINAMGWDADTEELVDAWGGTADLADGILRHPTDAFADDPLRVLRGVAFSARFGFDMAPETAELCNSIHDRFGEISTERVCKVWRQIATRGTDISKAINTLEATGWLDHFPELADTAHVEQDGHWHPEGNVLIHLGLAADSAAASAVRENLTDSEREIAVFAALLHDLGKANTTVYETVDGAERITSAGHQETGGPLAQSFLTRIGAPKELIDKIVPLVTTHMNHISVVGKPSGSAVRRLIRTLDNNGTGPTIYDWARLVDADLTGRGPGAKVSPSAQWIEVAERVGPVARKSLLTGGDLAAAGYRPGPGWGTVISAAVEAQDDGVFSDVEGAQEWFRTRKLAPVGLPARPSHSQAQDAQKWLDSHGR